MTVSPYVRSYLAAYRPYKNGAWCYEDGCIYLGLIALFEATGDRWYLERVKALVDGRVDEAGKIEGYEPDEFNIDNILPGRALVALDRLTGDPRYRRAIDRQAEQVESHPRTLDGSFWHKKIYPNQVWLDGLYMGLPFVVELGLLTGRPDLVDDAVAQIDAAVERLRDPVTGLYAHGFDESRIQRWADPATGRSPAFWSRSMGWLIMALVELIDLIPAPHPGRARMVAALGDLSAALVRHQSKDGRWWQVTDRPEMAGNYLETSATAMIAGSLLKGMRLGVLASSFAQPAARAAEALHQRCLVTDSSGRTRLIGICHVAGLGGFGDRYRDGSPGYYVSEPIVSDDPKGVGPFFVVLAEEAHAAAVADRMPA